MEELNKTQLILLAILLSFITSIATGIVTVTLLDQAPPAVTQTINRVVKETVREVVPQKPIPPPPPQTIVVKEEDFIVEATKKTAPNIVEIGYFKKKSGFSLTGSESGTPEIQFVGTGFVLSSDGVLATSPHVDAPDRHLFAKTANGMYYDIISLGVSEGTGVGFFKIGNQIDATGKEIAPPTPGISKKEEAKFPQPRLANSDNVEIGQTAIALGSQNGLQLLLGVISRVDSVVVPKEGGKPDETMKTNSVIYTTIGYDAKFVGGPLVKSDGQILGINFLTLEGERYTVPSNVLIILLSQVKSGKKLGESSLEGASNTSQSAATLDSHKN